MTSETTRHAIDALETLLDEERQALLAGDLEILAGQVEKKKTLIDALNDSDDAGGERLIALQSKALRNQALLDNALRGIRSVAKRMTALHQIRRSLDTYDEKGRKTTIESLTVRQMEKRA